MSNLTEEKIQGILRAQYMSSPKFMMENLFVFDWESDFLVKTKSGYWYEVEIKISFADFKNDTKNKKKKFQILNGEYKPRFYNDVKYRPNFFSYCVTEDMVEKVEPLLPPYAGLWYIKETHGHNWLVNVRAPKQLHSDKISDESLKLVDKFYYNYRTNKFKHDKNSEEFYQIRKENKTLKDTIKWLKAEYKAATGYDIKEVL